jgi:hypothetical protein
VHRDAERGVEAGAVPRRTVGPGDGEEATSRVRARRMDVNLRRM